MDRRDFIKKASLATFGSVVAPYILPSGRLFARTNAAVAEHVVYVLFAGGVRQQEAVSQRYLADSQNLPGIEGNIMYNLFNGTPPTDKVVYGTDIPGQPNGQQPIEQILSKTIQEQGTIFKEMVAINAGHYGGLNTLLTGNGAASNVQGLKKKPSMPTIFEYARRHMGLPATKTWFVGNGIGNSTPLLNFSTHENYGGAYGANFIAPGTTFGSKGRTYLSEAKNYHPEEQLSPMYEMKYFLDNTFKGNGGSLLNYSMYNTEEEKYAVKTFFDDMFVKAQNGQVSTPPVSQNADAQNIGWAIEVMKRFKPNITVVNLSSVDGCHGSFTGYLRSLHRADHAVGHLWNSIQSDPELSSMKDNTVMMVVPECGRNLDPNPILDENDWRGYDHSDSNTRRIWGAIVGPGVPAGLTIGEEGSPVGTSQDGALTAAEVLGFKDAMINAGHLGGSAVSMFDRF